VGGRWVEDGRKCMIPHNTRNMPMCDAHMHTYTECCCKRHRRSSQGWVGLLTCDCSGQTHAAAATAGG